MKKSPNLRQNQFKASSLSKEKIYINKNNFINSYIESFYRNYELWKKKGFNFIKKKWISNAYKKNDEIVIKYQKNYIKGKIVNLLKNGGIKLKIKNKTKEIFYGDQII